MAITRTEFIDKYGPYIAAVLVGALASVFTGLLGSIGGGVALAALIAALIYWDDWRCEKAAKEKNDAL